MKGEKKPHRLAQTAAGPVANNGGTHFSGRSEACACGIPGLGPAAGLDDQELAALGYSIADIKEFPAGAETLDGQRGRIGGFGRGVAGRARD
jgi:hypothetical protein